MSGAVVAFMTGRESWEGGPSELYRELFQLIASPGPRDWPKAANALMGRLRRLAPNLRRVHRLDFQTDRRSDSGRGRVARLTRLPESAGAGSSGPSGPSGGPKSQAARPDDPPDGVARPGTRPSDEKGSGFWGSDGPDGPDDRIPPPREVSREEYARFLDLH